MRRLIGLVALLALAGPSLADAEKVVRAELEKLKAGGARVQVIKDDALGKTFPNHEFVSVLFPQFPVGRIPPEPLQASNVYAVTKDDKATLISNLEELKKFFMTARFEENEAGQKNAARAWLRLAQELFQDGFYKFKIEDDSLKIADGKVSGKAVVGDGGNGEIIVTMTIKDAAAKDVRTQVNVKPGIRPRCHATLLLDANPLVRQIVEEDLLVMGRTALPYLEEQHGKAPPELKKAIERVRKRILAGER
jgi:hypothetical protein